MSAEHSCGAVRAASLTLCLGARKLDVFSAYLHNNGDRVAILREGFLSRFLGRWFRSLMVAAVLGLLAPGCLADGNNPITLETSETIFAVLTAMNTCGYNVEPERFRCPATEYPSGGGEESQEFGRGAGDDEHDVRVVSRASRKRSRA